MQDNGKSLPCFLRRLCGWVVIYFCLGLITRAEQIRSFNEAINWTSGVTSRIIYTVDQTVENGQARALVNYQVINSGESYHWPNGRSGVNITGAYDIRILRPGLADDIVRVETGGEVYNQTISGTVQLLPGYTLVFITSSAHAYLYNYTQPAHVVSVSMASDVIERGSVTTGMATGGRNGYQFAVISGGVSILGNSTTGAFTVAGSAKGTFEIQVWSPAGNGYAASNFAVGQGLVINAKKNKVTVNLDNRDSKIARLFKVYQDGVVIHEQTVAAGALVVRTFELATTSPVTVTRTVNGIEDDPIWRSDGTSTSEVEDGTFTPVVIDEDETPPPGPSTTTPPKPPKDFPENDNGKTVWKSITENNKDSSTNNKTYAEGVDKIVGAINEAKEDNRAIFEEAKEGNPTESEINDKAQAAQNEARELIPALESPPDINIRNSSVPDFEIRLPALMGGKTFDLNPFTSERFGGLVDWFRDATRWLAVVLFGLWASAEIRTLVSAFGAAQQAKGNPLIAGTGAQATAAVNAAIITAAFVVFIGAVIGYLTGEFSILNILNDVADVPMSGLPAKALWMLEKVFPIGTLLSLLALRLSFRFWGTQALAVAMAVIRWAVG